MHLGWRAVMIVAAALALAGWAAAGPGSPTRIPTSSSNRRAAERDTEQMLKRVMLPTSARVLSGEPLDDGGLLSGPPQTPATPNLVVRHLLWRVPMALTAVMAFVRAHVPRGARPAGSASRSGAAVVPNGALIFALPDTRQVSSREIEVNMVSLSAHVTGVRTDAVAVWVVPRAPGQEVPGGVHAIEITSRYPRALPLAPREVTGPKVTRIIGWINALKVGQPGSTSCPAESAGPLPTVSFTFLTAAHGRVLARALVPAFADDLGPCHPVIMTIANRGTVGLEGDHFLSAVQRLLRVHLVPAV